MAQFDVQMPRAASLLPGQLETGQSLGSAAGARLLDGLLAARHALDVQHIRQRRLGCLPQVAHRLELQRRRQASRVPRAGSGPHLHLASTQ